jgi:GMP synthase-like glutamine amidotransferase
MAELVNIGRPYRVLVLGGGYEYIKLMYDLQFSGAKTPEEADVILFTGGEDVHPSWYGENVLKCTFASIERDRAEKVVFDYAVEHGIPMIGICRGGQFLNVMSGGRMWQDVNNHCGNHKMQEVLPAKCPRKPRILEVTSTHHQMMLPTDKATVLAVGVDDKGKPLCTERQSFAEQVAGQDMKKYPDYEVLWYPETRALCFQPHPEFPGAPKACKEYFDEVVENYVLPHA